MPPNNNERIYFFRQGFVTFTIMIQSLSIGIILGFAAILNPAILDPDTADIKATSSDASWLTAILGYSGLVGFFILSYIMQKFGRKSVHILKNTLSAISWVMLFFARSLSGLYVARAIQGLTMGGIYINVIIIAEYSDPSRRGYFTAIQKVTLSLGTLFCHSMALCLTWRQVAIIALIPSALSTLLTFLWPESPFFLAMKRRYQECESSFHWLNGTLARNNELKELISAQKEKAKVEKCDGHTSLKNLWILGKSREFIRAFVIVASLSIAVDLCGRNYFKAYIVQIMTDLTRDKTIGVYISLLSDCIVIAALLLSIFVIKRYKRRKLMFTGGVLSIIILYTISLVMFLKNNNYVHISLWVSPCLILLMNFIVQLCVTPVAFAIIGEIFPLHLKGLGSSMSGVVLTASYGIVLKLTLVLMECIGIEGTYGIYGTALIVFFLILYFILPETKDKTLLEIENKLRGGKPVKAREMTLLQGDI